MVKNKVGRRPAVQSPRMDTHKRLPVQVEEAAVKCVGSCRSRALEPLPFRAGEISPRLEDVAQSEEHLPDMHKEGPGFQPQD